VVGSRYSNRDTMALSCHDCEELIVIHELFKEGIGTRFLNCVNIGRMFLPI